MSINPLKLWRLEHKLKQKELASFLNISRQTLSYIENDKINPNALSLLTIIMFTKIPLETLYKHYFDKSKEV